MSFLLGFLAELALFITSASSLFNNFYSDIFKHWEIYLKEINSKFTRLV